MSALIASPKLSGYNDTDLAFGMALPPMAREKIQGQATFSYEQSQIQSGRCANTQSRCRRRFLLFHEGWWDLRRDLRGGSGTALAEQMRSRE
jgi:hypothetical protein